jgi:hypothetical protein
MKKIFCIFLFSTTCIFCKSQNLPCSNSEFRRFDFWVGEWDAFGIKGNKAGDSKISVILDSCVILEEWTSASLQKGLRYAGKSFNTYNTATNQWQQTWVDNTGNTTEFLRGKAFGGKIVFYADKVSDAKGKPFIRRLTFNKLDNNKVRQVGEKSVDGGKKWEVEYDLEYRRKSTEQQ